MNKQELRRALEKYGNFMNVTQFAKFMGITRETARAKYLNELEHIPNGNEKLYFKEDLLNAILDSTKM